MERTNRQSWFGFSANTVNMMQKAVIKFWVAVIAILLLLGFCLPSWAEDMPNWDMTDPYTVQVKRYVDHMIQKTVVEDVTWAAEPNYIYPKEHGARLKIYNSQDDGTASFQYEYDGGHDGISSDVDTAMYFKTTKTTGNDKIWAYRFEVQPTDGHAANTVPLFSYNNYEANTGVLADDEQAYGAWVFLKGPDTAPTWQASTAYEVHDYVIPTTPGTWVYECTTAGTSNSGEPSPWNTDEDGETSDGTVTWTTRTRDRGLVGMEINVQEREGDNYYREARSGRWSTILQLVPESSSGDKFNINFGALVKHQHADSRFYVGYAIGQNSLAFGSTNVGDGATATDGGVGFLFRGSSTDSDSDSPYSIIKAMDHWSVGIDLTNATFKQSGSKAILLADDDNIVIGDGADYASLGYSSTGTAGVVRTYGGAAFWIKNETDDEEMAVFTPNGDVDLYYDDVIKFSTANSGVIVIGDVTMSVQEYVQFDSSNMQVGVNSGNDAVIAVASPNSIYLASGTPDSAEEMITCYANSEVQLFYDDAERLHTAATGIHVTGNVTSSGSCCGSDYVFEDDYKLLPLDELGEFVAKNNHLPNMTVNNPKNGELILNRGIEELVVSAEEQALYILQLHERLKTLEGGTKCAT